MMTMSKMMTMTILGATIAFPYVSIYNSPFNSPAPMMMTMSKTITMTILEATIAFPCVFIFNSPFNSPASMMMTMSKTITMTILEATIAFPRVFIYNSPFNSPGTLRVLNKLVSPRGQVAFPPILSFGDCGKNDDNSKHGDDNDNDKLTKTTK